MCVREHISLWPFVLSSTVHFFVSFWSFFGYFPVGVSLCLICSNVVSCFGLFSDLSTISCTFKCHICHFVSHLSLFVNFPSLWSFSGDFLTFLSIYTYIVGCYLSPFKMKGKSKIAGQLYNFNLQMEMIHTEVPGERVN